MDLVNIPHYTVAELFCGCGGFSHGFAKTGRFSVVLGNDIKPAALHTFRRNHINHLTELPSEGLAGDIREIPADEIGAVLARQGVPAGELDCLIGGPPCQGFSQMRRSEEREGNALVGFGGYNRLDQDPRNDLVLRFLEIAAVLQPKVIVIENVEQMLRHHHNGVAGGLAENVQAVLNQMGYAVAVTTLNAAHYGVPQLRERVIFLASRVGPVSFPLPTHSDPRGVDVLTDAQPWVSVADAIRDLPAPASGPEDALGGGPLAIYPVVAELSPYATAMRSAIAFPHNHLTRRYSPQIIRTIQAMGPGETWDHASARMRAAYQPILTEAMAFGEDLEQTIKRLGETGRINPIFFRDYYWSAYTRLAWEQPALTITANANFLGSGRFTHPVEHRGITMREAARLQSFEDDFCFYTARDGNRTNTPGVGLDMIGEAVPPLLGRALAAHIAGMLDAASAAVEMPMEVAVG